MGQVKHIDHFCVLILLLKSCKTQYSTCDCGEHIWEEKKFGSFFSNALKKLKCGMSTLFLTDPMTGHMAHPPLMPRYMIRYRSLFGDIPTDLSHPSLMTQNKGQGCNRTFPFNLLSPCVIMEMPRSILKSGNRENAMSY